MIYISNIYDLHLAHLRFTSQRFTIYVRSVHRKRIAKLRRIKVRRVLLNPWYVSLTKQEHVFFICFVTSTSHPCWVKLVLIYSGFVYMAPAAIFKWLSHNLLTFPEKKDNNNKKNRDAWPLFPKLQKVLDREVCFNKNAVILNWGKLTKKSVRIMTMGFFRS